MMEDKHLMSQGFFWTGSPFAGGWLGVADYGECQVSVSGGQGEVGGGGPQISRGGGGGHTRQGPAHTMCVT